MKLYNLSQRKRLALVLKMTMMLIIIIIIIIITIIIIIIIIYQRATIRTAVPTACTSVRVLNANNTIILAYNLVN